MITAYLRNPGSGARRQVRRRVVVGLREAEEVLAVGRDRHRPDADVPASRPAAGGDDVPFLVLELGLDSEPSGDLGADVDVEANPGAIRLTERLRLVVRIGRDAQLVVRKDGL